VPNSAFTTLRSGDVPDFDRLAAEVHAAMAGSDAQDLSRELAALYGSRAIAVIDAGRSDGGLERIRNADIIGAQIEAAVHDEMAVTLGDVIFRRTPLAAADNPGADVLESCARLMGEILGWTEARRGREIAAIVERFPGDNGPGRISEPEIETIAGTDTGR
jgi:glycerol-3-phosphate dehydrogenase